MSKFVSDPLVDLANRYIPFFVENFTRQVMGYVKGSHNLPADVLTQLITSHVEQAQAANPLAMGNSGTVNRFLFECAEFALEQNIANAESREVYDHIAKLPSIHHDDLNQMAFSAADLFRLTIDKNVVGTIARDASTAAQLITSAAMERTSKTETGGNLQLFGWGALSDGMYLNSALMYAADQHNLFKADRAPSLSWYKIAFDHAHQTAKIEGLSGDDYVSGSADVSMLLGDVATESMSELLTVVDQNKLTGLLCSAGNLKNLVTHWEQADQSPVFLMESVQEMTALVHLVDHMQSQLRYQYEDLHMGEEMSNRLGQLKNTLTMGMVGYEVLRETRFKDTLIMGVEGLGTDPTVNVVINQDNLGRFEAVHGQESDLIAFGQHLDPRKGVRGSVNGWSVDYALEARDTVVPAMMAEEVERVEQLRRNDAEVIRTSAETIAKDMVQSYVTARQLDEIPDDLMESVYRVSRSAIAATEGMSLDESMFTLLAKATGDSFVETATESFLSCLKSETLGQQYAASAAIARLAMDMVIGDITATSFDD